MHTPSFVLAFLACLEVTASEDVASRALHDLAFTLTALDPVSAFKVPVRAHVVMQGKGFGAPAPPPPAPKAKRRAPGATFNDIPEEMRPKMPQAEMSPEDKEAADSYDKLTTQGSSEYEVFIREANNGGKVGKWYSVGAIAVPRSRSMAKALSGAIYQNEDALLKGAFKKFPHLEKAKAKEEALDYGYRLKEFPDEEIMIADEDALKPEDNFFVNLFNQFSNPLNDGSGLFNPLKKE